MWLQGILLGLCRSERSADKVNGMKQVVAMIVGVVLLLQLSACGPTNVDQAALTFPHVVGTLPPVQLVLVADGPNVGYHVVCSSNGQYQSVNVEFHTANSDGGTGQGMAGRATPQGIVVQLATCTTGTIVNEGTLPPIGNMKIGDTIEISFNVTASNGGEQKLARAYVKGEDGALHSSD
jgi:hypothetical protein